jgi:hypothetical protein
MSRSRVQRRVRVPKKETSEQRVARVKRAVGFLLMAVFIFGGISGMIVQLASFVGSRTASKQRQTY